MSAGFWLHDVYKTELLRPYGLWIDGHPDFEGLAAWLYETYTNLRNNGHDEDQARAEILNQIRSSQEWKDKHQGTPSNPNSPTIYGRLRTFNGRLYDDRGPWRWKMVTAFDSLHQFTKDDDVDRYLDWALATGAAGVRVFCGWKQRGFDYRTTPDFWNNLRHYAAHCYDRDLRVEFCGVQDFIPDTFGEAQAFLGALASQLAPFDNATLEYSNEPWKNFPSNINAVSVPPMQLQARGSAPPDSPPYKSVGYTTHHGPRDSDWYRRVGKDCYDIQQVTNDVVVANEPTRGQVTGYNTAEHFIAGAAAAMFSRAHGCTAHGNSDTMQLAVVPTSQEAALVHAMFNGIDHVPIDAPVWAYARYGPDNPGIPMPVQEDTWGNDPRMHAKVGDRQAVVINYRGHLHDWTAQAANDWHIDEQIGPLVLCSR